MANEPIIPTTGTMLVLDSILSLQAKSQELQHYINQFIEGESQATVGEVIQMLAHSSSTMKTQSNVIQKLVEAQLVLDERLKDITKRMES